MASVPFIDHWKTLGFSHPKSLSTEEDFKAAYCKKASEWHDAYWEAYKDGSPEAEEELQKLNTAYEILSDRKKQRAWHEEYANHLHSQGDHSRCTHLPPPPLHWDPREVTEAEISRVKKMYGPDWIMQRF